MGRSTFARAAAAALTALGAAALTSAPAGAQIAAGSQFTFSGTADATDVGADGVVLAFGAYAAASGAGNTGSFAAFNALPGGAPVTLANVLVGVGPQPVPAFLTVGGYTFALAALPSGRYAQDDCYVAPQVGQRCTPIQTPGTALSPFYLANEATGDPDYPFVALAAFDFVGTVTDPAGFTSAFTGTISTRFVGASYQEVLQGLEAQGLDGVPGLPFEGTITAGPIVSTAAPEPGTVALVGAGLAAVAAAGRRRRRRA